MQLSIGQLPRGFRSVAGEAGLKGPGLCDCALIVSDRPCNAAALFTTNLVAAAPVLVGRELLSRHQAGESEAVRGVFINSKNANAVTGPTGLENTRRTASWLQKALGGEFFVMSTGVIGQQMPMDKLEKGLRQCIERYQAGDCQPEEFARAIMTTDTVPKLSFREGQGYSLAGVAKGAGMIHPNMATMLGVICCDVAATPHFLQGCLKRAADQSFHCISVDGDTSTNDTIVLLANGASGVALEGPAAERAFEELVTEICVDLAKSIAFDGEGAKHHVTLEVLGCQGDSQARQIGRTIITSPLVKTAIYGRDANWGRILAAAGRAGVQFDPAETTLKMGELTLLENGTPCPFDETVARQLLSQMQVCVSLIVGSGPGRATLWTCDLTEEYVQVNADYRT